MAYEIQENSVVYTGTVRADKDSQAVEVRWVFDFSNVEDMKQLWRMAVEPSGLVVKAQARWRRGKVEADATFDVQADFLAKQKARRSKTEKLASEVENLSDEDRKALLEKLQASENGSASGSSKKRAASK